MQLEDAQVEEADGHFDEVVGGGAGGEGGHYPLDGWMLMFGGLGLGGWMHCWCTDPEVMGCIGRSGNVPYVLA